VRGDDFERRVRATEAAFSAAARSAGAPITGDARVSEAVAAALIGYEQDSLRNLRSEGSGPAHYRISRVTYRLRDLAEWVEGRRQF